ncbi:hypothetical protein SDC9_138831 [bioreactor metagenome]|uniref:Uncharacterized protein n=1 Tax=bioreactor metagenome TaxID=1076179 RepID=A0A645DR18_9ZZZZ
MFLVGKGFGYARAGDGRFYIGVDFGNALFDRQRSFAHFDANPHHVKHADGHDAQKRQRQPPLEHRHGDERADERCNRNQNVLGAVVRKFGDVEQVRRYPAHELSSAHLVEKAERKLLNMRKDVFADIRFHQDAKAVPPVVDDIQQHRAHDIRRQRADEQKHKHTHQRGVDCHLRQERAQDILREHRVGNIDSGNGKRTA